jgi:hypothetical protein
MLALLCALTLGATGCGDPSADGATTTPSRTATPSPTVSATPTPTLEPAATEAIAAVEAFWAKDDDLGIHPDKRLEELTTVARDHSVNKVSSTLTTRRANSELQVGASVVRDAKAERTGQNTCTVMVCRSPGTAYEDRFADRSSPACGYRYVQQGERQVEATSYWQVEWSGIGQSGVIPLELTAQTQIVVGELQVLVTSGGSA